MDIDHIDKGGCAALYKVCQEGNHCIAVVFLQNSVDIKSTDENGWRPLQMACDNNKLKLFKNSSRLKILTLIMEIVIVVMVVLLFTVYVSTAT